MDIKTAVVERVLELCRENDIKPNELAVRSGVTPSTIYSMLDPRRKDLSIVTFKKICDGLDITLAQFFDTDVFNKLEQEIK
ncbi:transcriptional regulator [Clostridia bacterium]|nr:transcriptional regulator [Clostridia bacterium]